MKLTPLDRFLLIALISVIVWSLLHPVQVNFVSFELRPKIPTIQLPGLTQKEL